MAEGRVKIIQFNGSAVSYVSGELTAPEKGKFFFLTPPQGGKAGRAVGVVEFPASKTAYRIEPTGPDGDPELWRRNLDEVICGGMGEADPEAVAHGAKCEECAASGQTHGIVPLRLDLVPDYVPDYNAEIVSLQSYPGSPAVMLLDFAGSYTKLWCGRLQRETFDHPGRALRDLGHHQLQPLLRRRTDPRCDLLLRRHSSELEWRRTSTEASALALSVAGGFESPVLSAGSYQYNSPGGSGEWIFGGSPGNGSGIVSNGSGVSSPTAPEGDPEEAAAFLGSSSQDNPGR